MVVSLYKKASNIHLIKVKVKKKVSGGGLNIILPIDIDIDRFIICFIYVLFLIKFDLEKKYYYNPKERAGKSIFSR